jgi:hypothetical protein
MSLFLITFIKFGLWNPWPCVKQTDTLPAPSLIHQDSLSSDTPKNNSENLLVTTECPLLEILLNPQRLTEMDPREQSELVRQARHTGLLGFLEARIGAEQVSGKLGDHLRAAQVHASYNDRQISWQANRLEKALADLPGPVIFLKGAAYKALDLGLSEGRLASDVDLLVPREQLAEAEKLLIDAGWKPIKEDEYDQHYYREWMHELPPLRHEHWGTVVDLHHTILPLTSRLKPDAAAMIAAAVPMPKGPFYTLLPEHTVLHRAAHLFYGGDLSNSLRELVDIHELITLYSNEPGFVERLVAHARAQDLVKPLYYALYLCTRLLRTDIPPETVVALRKDAGYAAIRQLTCLLMEKQLTATLPLQGDWLTRLAGDLLFLRSHWITMPPTMLVRHLLTQTWRRGGLKTGQG